MKRRGVNCLMKSTELKALLKRTEYYIEVYIGAMELGLTSSDAMRDKDCAKYLRAEKRKAKQLLKEMR